MEARKNKVVLEMARDKDAWPTELPVREARAHRPAKSHPSGDALDLGSGRSEVVSGEVHHTIDRRRVIRRAFAFDPWLEAGEHCVRIERQGREHGGTILRLVQWRPINLIRRSIHDDIPAFALTDFGMARSRSTSIAVAPSNDPALLNQGLSSSRNFTAGTTATCPRCGKRRVQQRL